MRKREGLVWCWYCAPSPNAPYPGQLPGLPKEGSQVWAFSSCLHSSQRPQAQEFTFHSLGFSSHGGEAKQLKRRLGFLRACLYSFFFFFFFSVNIIEFGKGSKNTIVARGRDREGEGESIDLYAYIVMDKTDSLLFACFWKNKTLTLGFWAASPKMCQLDYKLAPRLLPSSRLVSRLSLCLLKWSVSRRQHRLQSAGLQAEPFDCGQQGVREN